VLRSEYVELRAVHSDLSTREKRTRPPQGSRVADSELELVRSVRASTRRTSNALERQVSCFMRPPVRPKGLHQTLLVANAQPWPASPIRWSKLAAALWETGWRGPGVESSMR
jgi:hypothetical protein